jgi:hypothetical protein
MNKGLFALLKAGILVVPLGSITIGSESNNSLLRKPDGQSKGFEAFLPSPSSTVPWLDLDIRTNLPKGDYPLGRRNAEVGPLILQTPNIQHADLAEFALGGN